MGSLGLDIEIKKKKTFRHAKIQWIENRKKILLGKMSDTYFSLDIQLANNGATNRC